MALLSRVPLLAALCLALASAARAEAGGGEEPEMGSERVVFQTSYGDIEFGFFPKVAPVTSAHMLKLARLGAFTSNFFFRVDKGFVAQVADVVSGREVPLNKEQRAEAAKTVPGEFSRVKHKRGILSMGRFDDPNSATSSFSMLLGDAPHLDGKYAVFGKVTKGDAVLQKLETLPTKTQGIFVMPLERVAILATYVYDTEPRVPASVCDQKMSLLRRRLVQVEADLQETRRRCLP